MKQIIFVLGFVLIFFSLCAQDTEDIVYLKNGIIVKGKIIENNPDKRVKIKTSAGSIFVYSYAEIKKIEKKSPNGTSPFDASEAIYGGYYPDYQIQSSIGVAIGGGGILGITYRYFPKEKVGIEGGLFYRPAVYRDYNSDVKFSSGLMLGLGPVFYLKSHENWQGKVKRNGISLKAGISPIGKFNDIFGSLNWVHDTYKQDVMNRYFSFELGLGAIYFYELPVDLSTDTSSVMPIIYYKVNWFFEI